METAVRVAIVPTHPRFHFSASFHLVAASACWVSSGQNGILSSYRSSARRRLWFILVPLLVVAVNAGGSEDDSNKGPPHPPWVSMVNEGYTFKQQQDIEQDSNGFDTLTYHGIDRFMDSMIDHVTMLEKGIKHVKQGLLQMRHHVKKQYGDQCPRSDVTTGPSGAERPDQTRKLKIRFNGTLKSTIYTNKPLQQQTTTSGGIEVAICRDDEIIISGDLASLTVEIVALESDHSCKDEWTEEDFDRQIRKSRDGQGSVLDGECRLTLVNGRASLGNIRFKESSTGTRTREFVLAARVCRSESTRGLRVEEAFMHPSFHVLVDRSKGNEKSSVPKLDDRVHDLKGIARNGPYAKRLEKENICTVRDFLRALNKDQHKLYQILGIKAQSSFDAIVKHARECDIRDKHELKSYDVERENVSLFFNCIYDLVGAKFHGHFVEKGNFDTRQKALVKSHLKQAYSKLNGITNDYVMENNHPVKISTSIAPAGSTLIPKLFCAPLQQYPGHESTFEAGNFSSYGIPLEDTNRNASGRSTPSELPHSIHPSEHEDPDGMKETWNSDTVVGCSEQTFNAPETPLFCPRAEGISKFSNVIEDNDTIKISANVDVVGTESIATFLSASPQNTPSYQTIFQGVEESCLPPQEAIWPNSTITDTTCMGISLDDINYEQAGETCTALKENCDGPIYSPEIDGSDDFWRVAIIPASHKDLATAGMTSGNSEKGRGEIGSDNC